VRQGIQSGIPLGDVFLEIDDLADIVSVFYDFWDELEDKVSMKADVLTPGPLTTISQKI